MAEAKPSLKIAIPKGSLQEPTIDLFQKAGYNIYVSSRGYRPASDWRFAIDRFWTVWSCCPAQLEYAVYY